jgi:RNA polymerase sigma-70 factor, ECF subfamily
LSFRTLQTRGRLTTAGEAKMSDESKAFKPGEEPSERRGERDLISRICRGERELFKMLIEPYQRTVFSVAYSVLNNAADAEEVAQEAFINAFRSLSGFRAEAKFSTWLIQITLNEARRRLRRVNPALQQSKSEPSNEADDYIPRDLADWREIPSEALARKELRQAMERTLCQLQPIYRQVLVLRDLQHLSTLETSELLGISVDLVKTRLRRARLQMREALAPGYDGSWTAESQEYRSVRPW